MRISRDNIDRFFDYSVLIDTRTIMLADEGNGVDDSMANFFIKALHLLETKSVEPIKIMLRSVGGCTFAGMAIFDAIAQSSCHITADVIGSAMSMGAVILQAADTRRIHPHALIMVHDGSFDTIGSPRDVENWGVISKELRSQMYDIFAKRSNKKARWWSDKCQADFIMTAPQALKLGFVDEVIQPITQAA